MLLFEIVLNGTAMFNHSNVRLPQAIDRRAAPGRRDAGHAPRAPFDDPRETDSNYGFNFPFWDRLFCTYIAQPKLGHEGMEIGLKEYRGPQSSGLLWALRLPFRRL